MKAMILAAGIGARLRPLTDDRPKALVEIAGHTLLEITISRLRAFGVREVIINVHHFEDMIIEYLKSRHNFGLRVEVSREECLLDTGGGLKKVAWFFLEGPNPFEKPFVVHNVDIVSTFDLARMAQFHVENHALATLAVQDRETFRYLLFDEKLQLCGRRYGRDGRNELVRPSKQPQALAFSCMHVISPRLLPMMTEEGAFPIMAFYLHLAAQGERILAFRGDEYYWRDLGKPEHVRLAEQEAARFGIGSG
jgi:NDP-sugar pyrophosphorylase family protein